MNLREQKVVPSTNVIKQFDRISYHKAGSVLRMIKNILGEDSWWTGVRNYLAENKFAAVNGTVLMNTLSRFAAPDLLPVGLSFAEVFDPWIRQEGYPILNVTRSGPGEVNVTVTRFQTDSTPPNWPESSYNYEWNIPFTYKTKFDNLTKHKWLRVRVSIREPPIGSK